MDNLINSLPPFLETRYGRAYFTLSTWDGGWQATYVDPDGFAMRGFNGVGVTIYEAVTKLKEHIDMLRLLEAPSGEVEEAERQPKTMGEEASD